MLQHGACSNGTVESVPYIETSLHDTDDSTSVVVEPSAAPGSTSEENTDENTARKSWAVLKKVQILKLLVNQCNVFFKDVHVDVCCRLYMEYVIKLNIMNCDNDFCFIFQTKYAISSFF